MFKNYIQLIKPGYIVSNVFTAVAGYLLATKHLSVIHFCATMIAFASWIASACIVNNYIDKSIDSKMGRTKKRPLVTGEIPIINAFILATILAVMSIYLFVIFTNTITILLAFTGMFFYLVLYSISKRTTTWSTVIGSVSAAVVPVAGYTAVTNRIDLSAILLFLILAFWQMPHFYSIGIYRRKEYENAHLPILSVAKGVKTTQVQILFYSVAFAVVVILLPFIKHMNVLYLILMPVLSVGWVVYASSGFFIKYVDKWARKMFLFSLIINMVWCITVIVNYFIS